jgi:hypothetical protein
MTLCRLAGAKNSGRRGQRRAVLAGTYRCGYCCCCRGSGGLCGCVGGGAKKLGAARAAAGRAGLHVQVRLLLLLVLG